MGISFSQNALVASPGAQYSFSSLVASTPTGLPQYLVLVGLDRDRYTDASNGHRGSVSGNGQTLDFHHVEASDHYVFGTVFSYTEQGYYHTKYGYLNDLNFTSSDDSYRNEYLSMYGFGSAGNANSAVLNNLERLINLSYFDGRVFMFASTGQPTDEYSITTSNYIGTLGIVTRPDFTDATPNVATPNEIVSAALSFVGQAWDTNGCWVLASNIAAMAGASLPVSSNFARPDLVPPQSNAGWMVAYNSTTVSAEAQKEWQSMLRPGDIIVANNSCGGHIATVVSGFGKAALVLDNSGDAVAGSATDIVIGQQHSLLNLSIVSDTTSIVVYRLDTPIVTALSPLSVASGGSKSIASLFSVSDPAGKAITSYQLYTGSEAGAALAVNGSEHAAHSAGTALTVDAAGLSGVAYKAGSAIASDSIMVRAFNGSHWGDWQSIDVAIGSGVAAPVVQAASQAGSVHRGQSVALSSLFSAISTDAAITSYTITDPAFGGSIRLNGAVNLASGQTGNNTESVYTVSAADFAKLTYTGDIYVGAELLTVSAANSAGLASKAVSVSMATVAPSASGVSHWVATDAEIPLAALFRVSQIDSSPIVSYSFLVNTTIIDSRGNTIVTDGSVKLNGAANLLEGTGAPAGNYTIAAADLDKVTFKASAAAGMQFLQFWANDGASGTPGLATVTTLTDAATMTARDASVRAGDIVSTSSLFALHAGGTGPAYYRLTDASGGGSLQLENSATNLQSKSSLVPGVFIVSAADLSKLSYFTGNVNGAEKISISGSSDMLHWSPEVFATITTSGMVNGQRSNDLMSGSDEKDTFDGGGGIDTVIKSGARAMYTITKTAIGYSVCDSYGMQGTDTLLNVERIKFDDVSLAFDCQGNAGKLYLLYQAAFNRTPDAQGFGYWLSKLDQGSSLTEIANCFESYTAYTSLGGPNATNADFLTHLYQNVLHHSPDTEGLQYWSGQLAAGLSRAEVISQIAECAVGFAEITGAMQNGIEYTPYY